MAQHPTIEELYEAHVSQIEGARGREIHRHLESCAECRQVLMDYRQLEQHFAQQPLDNPSPHVLDAISRKARQTVEKRRERWLWAFLRWDRAVGFAVVAVMAVGIGILYKTGYQHQVINGETAPFMSPAEAPGTGAPAPTEISTTEPKDDSKNRSFEVPPPMAPKKEKVIPVDFEGRAAREETKPSAVDLVYGGAQPSLTALPPVTEADKLFDKAEEAYKAGGHILAASRYRVLWKNYPTFSRRETVLFHWALCLEKLERKSEALDVLNELEKVNASYPGLMEAVERIK